MKIYTRKGDIGKTNLIKGNNTLTKSSYIAEVLGNLDELNVWLGYIVIKNNKKAYRNINRDLIKIQNFIFTTGSYVYGAAPASLFRKYTDVNTKSLEESIDSIDHKLSPISSFLYPNGCELSVITGVARTVCRRLERSIVLATKHQKSKYSVIVPYVNRLSDYLFVLSRYFNYLENKSENKWKLDLSK